MEEQRFLVIRQAMVASTPDVEEGMMMRSPAITVRGSVFAFFSRKKKMVFKLGDNYVPADDAERPFNPFKKKAPLRGWFEVDFDSSDRWSSLAQKALNVVTNEA